MLNVENLNISINEKQILSDISFNVSDGEFISIIGKSGCGKSVLLKTILGDYNYSGSIHISNLNHNQYLKNKTIGIAYQDFYIFPWLTIKENIKLVNCDNSAIFDLAEKMHISRWINIKASDVSIGVKQRASIIRSILTPNSDLILMDEPLCSVDELTSLSIRNELKEIIKNKTILYVTHNINEALELSNSILYFDSKNMVHKIENKKITNKTLLGLLNT